MPRLPWTSWAPSPTRASRTRDFTRGGTPGPGARGPRHERAGGRRRDGAGGQQPGQVAVQTRSRSTWIRPTRSTDVEATAYVYQADRQWRARVPDSGTVAQSASRTSFRTVSHATTPPTANSTAQTIIAVR